MHFNFLKMSKIRYLAAILFCNVCTSGLALTEDDTLQLQQNADQLRNSLATRGSPRTIGRVVGPQTQNKAANDVTQNTGVRGDAISSARLQQQQQQQQQQQPRLTSKQAQLKVETQFQAKTALATPKAAKLRPTSSGTIRKNVKPEQRVQVNPIPAEDADLVTGINSKQAVIPLSEDPAPLNTGRNPGVEGSWMNAGWPGGTQKNPSPVSDARLLPQANSRLNPKGSRQNAAASSRPNPADSRLNTKGSRKNAAAGSRLNPADSRLRPTGSRQNAKDSRLNPADSRLSPTGSRQNAAGSRLNSADSRLNSAPTDIWRNAAPVGISQNAATAENWQTAGAAGNWQNTAPLENSQNAATAGNWQNEGATQNWQNTAPVGNSQNAVPVGNSQNAGIWKNAALAGNLQNTGPAEKWQNTASGENWQNAAPVGNFQNTGPTDIWNKAGPAEIWQNKASGGNLKDADPAENWRNAALLKTGTKEGMNVDQNQSIVPKAGPIQVQSGQSAAMFSRYNGSPWAQLQTLMVNNQAVQQPEKVGTNPEEGENLPVDVPDPAQVKEAFFHPGNYYSDPGLSILPSSDGNYGQGYSNQDYNNSLNPQYWLVPELPWNDLMAVGFHRPDGTPHPLAYVLPPYWIMKALSDDRPMVDFPATHFQNGAWPYFAPPGDYVDEMAQVPYQYQQPISRQQPYVPPVGSAGYSLGNYGNPNPLPNYAYN